MKRFAALATAAVLSFALSGIPNYQHTASVVLTQPDSAYSVWQFGVTFIHQGDPSVDRPLLPDGKPAVSREDAINSVEQASLHVTTGYTITAKYGLCTNVEEHVLAPDGSHPLRYDNTPVWAVRVEGNHFRLADHFVWMVDAATGEVGSGYSV